MSDALPIHLPGHLLGHVLRFGRLLRLMGVGVNLSQILEWVRALEVTSIRERDDFYYAARTILISRHEDYPLFDQAFQLYWRVPEPFTVGGRSRRNQPPRRQARLPGLLARGLVAEEPEDEERQEERPSYSALESLREKNFAEMTWEEVQAARAAIAAMRWPIPDRATRRMRRRARGRKADLRHVVRDNLPYGGEPLRLRWLQRRRRRRPLVVLCDISGSMERYSRMLLHFVHALSHGMQGVESFLFGTRLTRITHQLRHRDVDDALDEVGRSVQDWSSGTRIGDSLKQFNYEWARRVLGRGAVVLIISDGWDRGEVEVLSREMARLQRASYRLIWLNPLLGSTRYEPVQRGMAASLPFVDDFLPVHNLNSLVQLAEAMGQLSLNRPERRQRPRSWAPEAGV